MRHSNHVGRGRRLPRWAVGFVAMIVIGCGASGTGSVPPSVAPTPVVTPDPHLKGPVTADQVYTILASAKLGIIPNNANLGHDDPVVVKQIFADLKGWPLRITEYRSESKLQDALNWAAGSDPGSDEPPYSFAAMNVLIQFGPISAAPPTRPEADRQEAAAAILAILDPLLWPIAQHSVTALPGRTPEPTAAPPSPSAAPSKKPAKTPKPTKAP